MTITCPSCGWSADVPEENIPADGRKGTCPKCKNVFEVRKSESQPPVSTFETSRPIDNTSPIRERPSVSQQPVITVYAGFWRRFVAILIDSIILAIAGGIVGAITGFIIGFIMGASGANMITIQAVTGLIGFIIGIVLNWLYFTLLESSSKQATFGKMALGLIVTDLNGRHISFGKANGRYWGKIVSAITLFVGFIMAGFTLKKQALHDIIASTLVVKK